MLNIARIMCVGTGNFDLDCVLQWQLGCLSGCWVWIRMWWWTQSTLWFELKSDFFYDELHLWSNWWIMSYTFIYGGWKHPGTDREHRQRTRTRISKTTTSTQHPTRLSNFFFRCNFANSTFWWKSGESSKLNKIKIGLVACLIIIFRTQKIGQVFWSKKNVFWTTSLGEIEHQNWACCIFNHYFLPEVFAFLRLEMAPKRP